MAKARLSVYDSFSDPGHGWLKVERKELDRLGIADKITSYSYVRGDHVYLEEDCDLSLFMDTKAAAGEGVAMRHHNSNNSSRIRSYACYHA